MQVACAWRYGKSPRDDGPRKVMLAGTELFTVNLYVALASPLVGSAIAAGAARFAKGQGWGLSPSCCPACGRRLGAIEMVPVVSWLAQRGRCRGCAASISADYPVIEALAGGVALWAWLGTPPHVFALTCLFGWLLLALAAIDYRTRRLPDILTAALAVSGLSAALALWPDRFWEHAVGALTGCGTFAVVAWVYRQLRDREGLGSGDAKLLGGVGAWIGVSAIPVCVFVAALSATVCVLINGLVTDREVRGDAAIAFGPFLAGGGWVVWVYGTLTA
jgi:leader peptidase (prepilin peptidase)/N-methyltransferase